MTIKGESQMYKRIFCAVRSTGNSPAPTEMTNLMTYEDAEQYVEAHGRDRCDGNGGWREMPYRQAKEWTALSSPQHTCPYCGGPARCANCGRTCTEAGGLTPNGLCAGCAVKASQQRREAETVTP